MIVPGGGIAFNGNSWVACRPGFFPTVHVLSRLFRRLCLKALAPRMPPAASTAQFGAVAVAAQKCQFRPARAIWSITAMFLLVKPGTVGSNMKSFFPRST